MGARSERKGGEGLRIRKAPACRRAGVRAEEARPCLLRMGYRGDVRGEAGAALRGGVRLAGRDTVPDPGLKPHVAKCPSRTLGVPRTVAGRRPQSRTPQTRTSFAMPCQAHHIGADFRPPISTHTVYPAAASAADFPTLPRATPNWPPMLSALRQGGDDVLVVMEASGGCERALHHALVHAGVPTAIVNPKRVRDFARSQWLAGEDRPGRRQGAQGVRGEPTGRARRRFRNRPGPT